MKRNFFNKMMLCAAAVCSGMLYTSCADNLDEGNDNGKVENGIALNCNVGNYKTDADVQLVRALDVKLPNGRNAKLVECDFNFIDDDVVNQAVAQTRGTMINNISQLKDQKLKVNLYFGNDNYPTATTNATCTGEYTFGDASNLVKVNNTAKDWDRTNPYAEFAAIYPTDDALSKDFKKTEANKFSFSYTAPTKCQDQKDVMVAYAQAQVMSGQKAPVPTLTLKHALTAINFAVGNNLYDDLTLIGATLEDEKGAKGTCTIKTDKSGVQDFTWDSETKAKYTLKLDKEIELKKSSNKNTILTGDNNNYTFFVMPKTDGKVTLSLLFKDKQNKLSKISKEITPNWRAGHTITYTLGGKSSYIFQKDVTKPIIANDKGEVSFKLQSFHTYSKKQEDGKFAKPIEWEIESYKYDGKTEKNAPEWFEIKNISTKGSIALEEIKGTFKTDKIQKTDLLEELNKYLKTEKLNNKSNPYNLAGENGTDEKMSTANCYIVEGPGTYKIPLVYGNALVDGKTNSAAYKSGNFFPTHTNKKLTGEECQKVPNFNNGTYQSSATIYSDVEFISTPWIKDNGSKGDMYKATDAEVVWTDVSGFKKGTEQQLITNAKVDGDYLVFTVSKENLENGNAVIAVKNKEKQILWSWHLWFTRKSDMSDFVVTKEKNNVGELLTRNLGWKFTEWTGIPEKEIKLTLKQKESNKTLEVTFVRNASLDKINGKSPVYQTFRKDPLSMEYTQNDNGKTRYGEYESVKQENKNDSKLISYGYTIQNPSRFFSCGNITTGGANSFIVVQHISKDGDIKYFWDTNKTVYDPCPVGYQVPNNAVLECISECSQKEGDAIVATIEGRKVYFPVSGLIWGSVGNNPALIEQKEARYGCYDGFNCNNQQLWKRPALLYRRYNGGAYKLYYNKFWDVPSNATVIRPMKSPSKQ